MCRDMVSMSSESPKRVLFGQFAAVAKAAAHPYRLELLEQLAQGERSVEVLADRLKLSMANTSQHLQHMRRGGLVAARRCGASPRHNRPRSSVSCAATLQIAMRSSLSRGPS